MLATGASVSAATISRGSVVARQSVNRGLVLQQAGEAAQDVEVGVGLSGDGDDEANRLAFVPR
jgi:hypothetical protein